MTQKVMGVQVALSLAPEIRAQGQAARQGLSFYLQQLWAGTRWGLGLDAQTLTLWQIVLRVLIVYLAALAIVRIGGGKRFLGKHAPFDAVLGIIFGSLLSRAISASAPFFETLGAGIFLAGLHVLFARIALYSHDFGALIKGNPQMLIKDGEIQWEKLQQSYISKEDLIEALRANGKLSDPSKVQIAHLERSGAISVIPHSSEPRVIEVKVEAGVQTVRIELE